MIKVKHKEIKIIREQWAQDQGGLCLLCEHPLDAPVLDHDHKHGHLRGVLCRGCNSLEGKITNNLARSRMTPDKLVNFLANYLEYTQRTTDLIHPTHGAKKRR